MSDLTEITDLESQQLKLEHESAIEAVAKYHRTVQQLEELGMQSKTAPIRHLMRAWVKPVSDGLLEFVTNARSRPGRSFAALPFIEAIADRDAAAFVALKVLFDTITIKPSMGSICIAIGRAIEQEQKFGALLKEQPKLVVDVNRRIANSPKRSKRKVKENALELAYKNHMVHKLPAWDPATRLRVGSIFVDLMISKTGMIEIKTRHQKYSRSSARIEMTQETLEWIREHHHTCAEMTPTALPMVCPPRPYTSFRCGGYLTPKHRKPLARIRGPHRKVYTPENCKVPYEAVNYLMSVPYRINIRVFETIRDMWQLGRDIPGAARYHDLVPTIKPPDSASAEEKKLWLCRTRELHNLNDKNKSNRMEVSMVLATSSRFLGRDIWFPGSMDFRGRFYYDPSYLTPQGTDLAKGMLQFANGVSLTERGLWWMKVHAANSYGVDKVSFDDRVRWTEENLEKIRKVSQDPLADYWWHDASSPVQFLAACMELVEALKGHVNFLTHLPVSMDGTCNGIQHLAALSRDRNAGNFVNLCPGEKPSDVYGVVAEAARGSLQGHLGDHDQFAERWLQFGVDRSICKRPTMILPYGGTRNAVRQYIDDEIAERLRKGNRHPFGPQRIRAANYLADVVWEAMGSVIAGPRRVMQWTRQLASAVNKKAPFISWTTPSGFVVVQHYPNYKSRQIETILAGKLIYPSIQEPTKDLDAMRMVQALAPNWIHSLDASALHMTAVAMRDLGYDMVAVHDSFGTHASHVDAMNVAIRQVFVQVHSGNLMDALIEDLKKTTPDLKVPDRPPLGDLRIEDVMDSKYFFA